MSNELRVDVGQDATPDFQAGTVEQIGLECQVVKVNVLHAGRALYLDQIPLVVIHRIQDVGAGVTAVEREGGFVQRAALPDGHFRRGEDAVEIVHPLADFDAVRK